MSNKTIESHLMLLADMLAEGETLDSALAQLKTVMDPSHHAELERFCHDTNNDKATTSHRSFALVTASIAEPERFQSQLSRVRNRQQLWQRLITSAVSSVSPHLNYLAALSVLLSVFAWIWLIYVANNFTAFFDNQSRSSLSGLASVIEWTLANPNATSLLILGVGVLGLLMGYLSLTQKRETKKLSRHVPANRFYRWFYPQLAELQQLLFHPTTEEHIERSSLFNNDEKAELRTSLKLKSEQSTLDRLLSEDTAHFSNRISQRAKNILMALTLIIWTLIGLFVLSAYSIIFNLGKAI